MSRTDEEIKLPVRGDFSERSNLAAEADASIEKTLARSKA
ncbi:hypothetical protein AAW51_2108 [Caldimonas brevitalea]|uniref:Uncharacterized protein n=1 Tax=Caldimonas brevitalea TaxID=413882 RepID=A0A0G3BHB6_9BURK|nr:hypothetical protein AAW51_2108 [Caldimonas brevitalea]